MLDKWQKKEKPVFTGITRGIGGFGFGAVVLLVADNFWRNSIYKDGKCNLHRIIKR